MRRILELTACLFVCLCLVACSLPLAFAEVPDGPVETTRASSIDGKTEDEGCEETDDVATHDNESTTVAQETGAQTDPVRENEGQAEALDSGQKEDAGEVSERSVALVACGPEVEDVLVWVPDDGAQVPPCPFEWERHLFVGWESDVVADSVLVPGEELPDVVTMLCARWRKVGPQDQVEGLDFSSCRLLVGSSVEPGFGKVLSSYDGVWLVEFEDAVDAAWAYVDHKDEVEFLSPDIEVAVAENGSGVADEFRAHDDEVDGALADVGFSLFDAVRDEAQPEGPAAPHVESNPDAPIADLSAIGEAEAVELGTIALVDTGVNGYGDNVCDRLSVIGETWLDDNGHGTSMMGTIVRENPQARVVSIKALDAEGRGSASSVYAAIEAAIRMRVKVVNLSLYAPAVEGNAAVEQAIRDAYDAGVIVVGAAGNDGRDAKWYLPGKMLEEAVIVGSCDSNGVRNESSNYGSSVDVYVPSRSTSFAAAKVSGWLCAHGTFGHELDALGSMDALETLGLTEDAGERADAEVDEAPAADSFATAAWTHPSMQVRAHFSNIGWKSWTNTNADTPSTRSDADSAGYWQTMANGVWQNIENIQVRIGSNGSWTNGGSVQYRAYYQDTGYDSWRTSPNSSPATTGNNKRVEGAELKLTGNIANAYSINYKVYTITHSPSNSPGDDASLNHKWFSASDGGYAGTKDHDLGIELLRIWLTPKSFNQVVQVRYQNANGGYGSYTNVINTGYTTGSTVSWSRAQDSTYNAASVSYEVTAANTKQINITRRSATNTIQARYQNADGTWGSYSNVSSGSDLVGAVRSWSRAQDATYEAASASITGTASAQTKKVDVARRSYTIAFDGNGATSGSTDSMSCYVGQEKELTANGFRRGGFAFRGWNTEADGSGAFYADGQNVKDLAAADGTVRLYALWESLSLRVVVPVAIHYVAQGNGVLAGPDDGVAYVQNCGDVSALIADASTEVYEPYDATLSLALDKERLVPGESLFLHDLIGSMSTPVLDEREIGCIHWTFRVEE